MSNEGNPKVTFAEGQQRLANVLSRLNEWIFAKPASIELKPDLTCERCGYEECVCGDPDFEVFVSQALDAAAEVDIR
jgi:hypothetical protein